MLSEDNMSATEWKEKGNILFKNKQFHEAAQYYSKSIELEPNNAVYWSNRAAAYLNDQKFKLALNDCIKACQLDSGLVKAFFRAAKCQVHLGNLEDALEQVKLIEKIPSKIPNHKESVMKELAEIQLLLSKLAQYHDFISKEDYSSALKVIEEAMIVVDSNLAGSGIPNCN